jgi:transposase-like protein
VGAFVHNRSFVRLNSYAVARLVTSDFLVDNPICVQYHICMRTKKNPKHPELGKSDIIRQLPQASADETAAVEFFEQQRWGDKPCCPHCNSAGVYKMTDRDGTRNKRYLWRCRGCAEQYTVRIGAVYEESRLPLRHWAYAFWRAASSKKGISAREIQRHCQITHKSALFLLHRIRFALTPNDGSQQKLNGTVECDEVYLGGRPRPGTGPHKRGRGTKKVPVFAIVERDGSIRSRVVPNVTGKTLKSAILECVDPAARIMTDELSAYNGLRNLFRGGHEVVKHSIGEYARGDAYTNTVESSFSLLKRGLNGIYHAVSKEHLPKYIAEFDFRWNTRKLNDGERTARAIRGATGKRLTYRKHLADAKRGYALLVAGNEVVSNRKRRIRRSRILKRPVFAAI